MFVDVRNHLDSCVCDQREQWSISGSRIECQTKRGRRDWARRARHRKRELSKSQAETSGCGSSRGHDYEFCHCKCGCRAGQITETLRSAESATLEIRETKIQHLCVADCPSWQNIVGCSLPGGWFSDGIRPSGRVGATVLSGDIELSYVHWAVPFAFFWLKEKVFGSRLTGFCFLCNRMRDTNKLCPTNALRMEMSTRLADNGTDMCKAEVPNDDSSRVDFRQVSDQVTACVKQNLANGNAIRIFYHMNDHPCNYRH